MLGGKKKGTQVFFQQNGRQGENKCGSIQVPSNNPKITERRKLVFRMGKGENF